MRAVRGRPGLEEGEEEARERADVEEAWWEMVRQWHAQATAQNEHLAPVRCPKPITSDKIWDRSRGLKIT